MNTQKVKEGLDSLTSSHPQLEDQWITLIQDVFGCTERTADALYGMLLSLGVMKVIDYDPHHNAIFYVDLTRVQVLKSFLTVLES